MAGKTKTEVTMSPTREERKAGILVGFRSHAQHYIKTATEAKARFLEAATDDATTAIGEFGQRMVNAIARAEAWQKALTEVDQASNLRLGFAALAERAQTERHRILETQPWKANSTDPFVNVAKAEAASGTAKAWVDIGDAAKHALEGLNAE